VGFHLNEHSFLVNYYLVSGYFVVRLELIDFEHIQQNSRLGPLVQFIDIAKFLIAIKKDVLSG